MVDTLAFNPDKRLNHVDQNFSNKEQLAQHFFSLNCLEAVEQIIKHLN